MKLRRKKKKGHLTTHPQNVVGQNYWGSTFLGGQKFVEVNISRGSTKMSGIKKKKKIGGGGATFFFSLKLI
jgi:hypothetical protein